jgi:hypothetical protein
MPAAYPLAQPNAPVTANVNSSENTQNTQNTLTAEVQVLTTAMEKAVANIVLQSEINTDVVRRLLALEQKFAKLPASREAHRGS